MNHQQTTSRVAYGVQHPLVDLEKEIQAGCIKALGSLILSNTATDKNVMVAVSLPSVNRLINSAYYQAERRYNLRGLFVGVNESPDQINYDLAPN